MPQVVVVDVTVLVPLLAFAAGPVEVTVSMRIEVVARSQQAGQGAGHSRVLEHPPDVGNARQDVVAGVAFVLEHLVDLLADAFVEGGRVVGANGQIPVHDELLYLFVR